MSNDVPPLDPTQTPPPRKEGLTFIEVAATVTCMFLALLVLQAWSRQPVPGAMVSARQEMQARASLIEQAVQDDARLPESESPHHD